MATFERSETFDQPLGRNGSLAFQGVAGTVRLRGDASESARVKVRYRVQADDEADAERSFEAMRLKIDRSEGRLAIESPIRQASTVFGIGLAILGSDRRRPVVRGLGRLGPPRGTVDVEIDLPREATVRVDMVSGPVRARDLLGEQRYQTVSGDIDLAAVGGAVDAATVSGTIRLQDGEALRLTASSVSGDISAHARRFDALRLSTTSGHLVADGELAEGAHHVDSISGDLEIATPSGLGVELRTLSGAIRSEVAHRLDGGRGRWHATVGDARARLRFDSTSGSLWLRRFVAATRPEPDWGGDAEVEQAADTAPATVEPSGPVEPAPAAELGAASGSTSGSESGPTPGPAIERETDERSAEQAQLDVLRALERGDIDVDEAADRLARVGR